MPSVIKKETYSVEKVLPSISAVINREGRLLLDGDWVRVGSIRMRIFIEKGLKCVSCGIAGSFFRKELDKHCTSPIYHLNLYAIGNNNQHILMTKDHIIPISKGGPTTLDNLQPMCAICNCEIKGNKI